MPSHRSAFAFLLLLLLPAGAWAGQAEPVVAGYVFPRDSILKPGQIDPFAMTRINYAFANLGNGRMVEGFAADAANFAALTALRKQNPRLSILVSVGGWTWSGQFSDMALAPASRAVFIDSVADFLRRYDLDGLDIDWEYPGLPGAGNTCRPEDKQNFTALLRELRHRLDRESRTRGRRQVLTIAAGASEAFLAHTEMRKAARYLDTVNLMAYDYYVPSGAKLTGHHAPLYTNPADPAKASADASVKLFEQAGVPARKLVLGVPFYGHMWGSVPPAGHGLYQPGGPSPKGNFSYQALKDGSLGPGYERFWDEVSQVPYLYNAGQQTFVSYEDPQSLKIKANYIRTHRLGGVMFWSYESDPSGELLRTLDDVLRPGAWKGAAQ